MSLVFATNNAHKIQEINSAVGPGLALRGLKEIGCTEDIPETAPDLQGNALQKARYVKEHYGHDCFADDTGLEVLALDGEPGVLSARYAGPQRSSEDNMDLLLQRLADKDDRRARFRAVIALLLDGEEHLFEGSVEGMIIPARRGGEGFGYDPIFQPDGFEETFAEMSIEQKNEISHRGRAVAKLIAFLKQRS